MQQVHPASACADRGGSLHDLTESNQVYARLCQVMPGDASFILGASWLAARMGKERAHDIGNAVHICSLKCT